MPNMHRLNIIMIMPIQYETATAVRTPRLTAAATTNTIELSTPRTIG